MVWHGDLSLLIYIALSFSLINHKQQEYSVDKSEQLYEVLNRKHFIEGELLNDMAVLVAALVEIGGVDVPRCESFLRSEAGVEAVLRTVDLVHQMGIASLN